MDSGQDLTRLLEEHNQGDAAAMEKIFNVVYRELRRLAQARLRVERGDHTLNATALVHEAYLKLVQLDRIQWKNRVQFFAIAARAMRNILVDYAVRRGAKKRQGGRERVALEDVELIAEAQGEELLALEEALKKLEQLDPRQVRVVECRFFGGMSIEESAEAIGVSPATVTRDWNLARAWLNREMGG